RIIPNTMATAAMCSISIAGNPHGEWETKVASAVVSSHCRKSVTDFNALPCDLVEYLRTSLPFGRAGGQYASSNAGRRIDGCVTLPGICARNRRPSQVPAVEGLISGHRRLFTTLHKSLFHRHIVRIRPLWYVDVRLRILPKTFPFFQGAENG